MIYIDTAEHERVKARFKKRLGDRCKEKTLGVFDCEIKKILLQKCQNFYCAQDDQIPILCANGFYKPTMRSKCSTCEHKTYVRFADFEIAPARAYYERKTAADFVGSRKDRLYDQLNRMDMFISGRKGLILEGMPRHESFNDSKDFFSGYDKRKHDLRGLSPLEQAIEIAGGDKERNWCLSFIRECKMRDIEFVQTWDLDETITFLEQCDEGYDETPKLRVIPKRYPDIPLETD